MKRSPTLDEEATLSTHLEALRTALLRCVWVTCLLFPIGYWLSPNVIAWLIEHSFPASQGALHYFAPMEVFWVQLRLGLVLALVIAFPWNAIQIWRFLLPALYPEERRDLLRWVFAASGLFFLGVGFCVTLILPLLMRFSLGFATPQLEPLLGLGKFIELSGWLMLSFGILFQIPVAVLLAVRFRWVNAVQLQTLRPYVMTLILVLAAVLTPPDVVSQILLAVPTWLLFEWGLWLARRLEQKSSILENNHE